VYSQVIKGAQYMAIAAELEVHAAEELSHALIVSKQIDYLGGTPTVQPKPVKIVGSAGGSYCVSTWRTRSTRSATTVSV
jgi:bacterioferritin